MAEVYLDKAGGGGYRIILKTDEGRTIQIGYASNTEEAKKEIERLKKKYGIGKAKVNLSPPERKSSGGSPRHTTPERAAEELVEHAIGSIGRVTEKKQIAPGKYEIKTSSGSIITVDVNTNTVTVKTSDNRTHTISYHPKEARRKAEEYEKKVQEFNKKVEEFNKEVKDYENLLEKYKQNPSKELYEKLQKKYEELIRKKEQLEKEAGKLHFDVSKYKHYKELVTLDTSLDKIVPIQKKIEEFNKLKGEYNRLNEEIKKAINKVDWEFASPGVRRETLEEIEKRVAKQKQILLKMQKLAQELGDNNLYASLKNQEVLLDVYMKDLEKQKPPELYGELGPAKSYNLFEEYVEGVKARMKSPLDILSAPFEEAYALAFRKLHGYNPPESDIKALGFVGSFLALEGFGKGLETGAKSLARRFTKVITTTKGVQINDYEFGRALHGIRLDLPTKVGRRLGSITNRVIKVTNAEKYDITTLMKTEKSSLYLVRTDKEAKLVLANLKNNRFKLKILNLDTSKIEEFIGVAKAEQRGDKVLQVTKAISKRGKLIRGLEVYRKYYTKGAYLDPLQVAKLEGVKTATKVKIPTRAILSYLEHERVINQFAKSISNMFQITKLALFAKSAIKKKEVSELLPIKVSLSPKLNIQTPKTLTSLPRIITPTIKELPKIKSPKRVIRPTSTRTPSVPKTTTPNPPKVSEPTVPNFKTPSVKFSAPMLPSPIPIKPKSLGRFLSMPFSIPAKAKRGRSKKVWNVISSLLSGAKVIKTPKQILGFSLMDVVLKKKNK